MENNFFEELQEYFKNTPREKVLEDWSKTEEYDNIGPTVEEFLGFKDSGANYQVITDKALLIDFIDNWLPELKENECYYFCLFARSKYAKNEDGSNKFSHIKTDKAQLKRFVATKKGYILHKIQQLEVKVGAYKTKDGDDIPQEALALYVNPGPRNQKKAMFTLMKRLIDIQMCEGQNFNIHAEALSAIQKSKSKSRFIDFDIDSENAEEEVFSAINFNYINKEALHFLKTRGGMHVLVDTTKIEERFQKSWYRYLTGVLNVDIKGDNMIPVPGTYQGGFTPHFVKRELTKEDILYVVESVFNNPPENQGKREIKVLSGCKTYGFTDFKRVCDDKDCLTCRSFAKAFMEEVENFQASLAKTPEKRSRKTL